MGYINGNMSLLSTFYPAPVVAGTTAGTYAAGDDPRFSPALNDLSNVSAATPSDNDVLVFDTATSTWVAEAPATVDLASPPAIGNTTPAAISGTTGTFTTLTANNGTLTASAPVFTVGQTWNNASTTFAAFVVNATNTASNAESTLADFQVGGVSQLRVLRDGSLYGRDAVFGSVTGFRFGALSGGAVSVLSAGQETIRFSRNITPPGIQFTRANSGMTFEEGSVFYSEASNTLAQRGSNQEFRLYGTFTSATNYQRMTVKSVRTTLSALSGASVATTGTFIPDGAVVVGVTTRVSTLLTGADGYQVGDGTDADRWGDITGTAIGTTSDNRDWTAGTIECFTAGGEITLTAKTANFTAGAIEICVFYLAGQAD
jgi:hypothetical protein